MIYVIVVIVFCLVHIVDGQTLDNDDDIPDTNMDIILDLQSRLAVLERFHNELEKQHKIDQNRIVTIDNQQAIDRNLILDLVREKGDNQLRISDLEKQRQTDQLRISDLEKQRQTDHLRISDLEKQRQTDQLRISDLEKQRQTDQLRISDLEKQRQTDQLRISDLEKQRQTDQLRISQLKNNMNYHKYDRTTTQNQKEFLGRSNVVQKTTLNTRTLNATRKDDESRPPSFRNTRMVLTQESMNPGKRVSDNSDTVAFYAILSHGYDPMTDLMEIHFDNVITNVGNSYSGQTGTFRCQRPGVYVFTWILHVTGRWAFTELVKNGVMVGTAFAGDSQYSITGGNTVVVELSVGDDVWIRVVEHMPGTIIYNSPHRHVTSFSGFLLK
ncbi:uncharacterized protein PF3D7_1120000-like [Argopecten irradians]|uniref:uncharacterized protein PF3D7_1120000-like n=1 Tax=Argopecten irradians TaxID=31199 RepID=UPI003724C1C2